ncbi:uncharacterized protein C22orf15 homolog isoform X2 [Manis javanica]|uniref:uncharacterized protein C22orf15 homolog isoform X2 n=1 Tax=Manis javanica TaxID=9974 RepID=UPI003C6D3E9D
METSLEAGRGSVVSCCSDPEVEGWGIKAPHLPPLPCSMLITVMFGAGCRELLNPWCSLVTLTAHLRQRGQVPQDASIALLSEDGHLVSLEEGASQAPPMGSTLLQERGTYVLVQIITALLPILVCTLLKAALCLHLLHLPEMSQEPSPWLRFHPE